MTEYVRNGSNATAAYQAAYPGASAATAKRNGCRLLTFAHIQKELAKYAEKLDATQERIQKELAAIAFLDVRGLFNPDGSLRAIHELPEEITRALSSLEIEELYVGRGEGRTQIGNTKKVRLLSKLRALELLGKQQGMFVDRVEVTGLEELERALREGRERVNGYRE